MENIYLGREFGECIYSAIAVSVIQKLVYTHVKLLTCTTLIGMDFNNNVSIIVDSMVRNWNKPAKWNDAEAAIPFHALPE